MDNQMNQEMIEIDEECAMGFHNKQTGSKK